MEKIELRMSRAEEEIKELKKYREECLEKNHATETSLVKAIQKMEDLITTVENLPKNIESSMIKTMEFQNEIQKKEHEKIYNEISDLRKDKDELDKKIANLQKIVDERTIVKDSNNYQKYIFEIIKYLILAILGYVVIFK